MTEPSDKAVELAADAVAVAWDSATSTAWQLARAALQAAYPIIEADIRAKIAAEIEAQAIRRVNLVLGGSEQHLILLVAYGDAVSIARGEASA